MGSIKGTADNDGTLLSQTNYDAFGKQNGSASYLGFTGREHDSETGLIYYRARYMDPVLGRFTSEDPIGFAAGDFNVARYVGNSPLNWVDPSGNVTAKEYATFKSRVALAVKDCLQRLAINSTSNLAAGAVYTFLVNGQIYIGISNDPNRRAGEHTRKPNFQAAKALLRKTFMPFYTGGLSAGNRIHLRQIEQHIINMARRDFGTGALLNKRFNELPGGRSACD
jgi:RHS repeat-associated protein